MSNNTDLTPSLISKETLLMLANNTVAAGKVNRKFENQFVKIGSTLTIRKPNRFKVTSGPGLSIQDITEPSTSITISNQKHVDFQFSQQELTLVIEEFSERYLKPAAEELANQLDYDVITNFQSVSNIVGTPGTVPANFAALGAVGQRMDENAAPQERCLILNPAAYWAMAAGLSGLYVQAVSQPALKGYLANIANFEIYQDQNVQNQTVGAYAGSGVTNGAGQTGSSLVTNGWTASITGLLNVGDVFTIAGVYNVNPKNRQSTGVLKNFTLAATASSDSGGNATLQIIPAIVTTGAYQNVSNAPASGAAITVKTGTASNTYANNIGFVRDTFGLVTVPMNVPANQVFGASEEYKGLSLRILRAYDIQNDVEPCRVDLLYGTTTYYEETGCRLTN